MRFSVAFAALLVASCGSSPKPKVTTGGGSAVGTGSNVAPVDTTPKLDETQALALDPTIKKGVLANGLTYYVKSHKKPEKRVQLWLAINAGSVLEDDKERGMAHLLEHIAFEGTKRFPKHEIQDFIERAGMKFGADLNAYTSFDETVYQLMVPTDDPKTVGKGLDVLRDWAADITFDPKEVIDERKIIEEERRTRNSAGFRMIQTIFPVAYQGSKHAQRLPIGTTEVINGATAPALVDLYKKWYRPELMAVIVVGDVDANDLEAQVKAKFGDIAKSSGAPARPEMPIDTKVKSRSVVARDKEQATFQISLDYQMPHRPAITIGDAHRAIIEEMFTRLVNERLAILSKRPKAAWIGASVGFGANLRPVDEMSFTAIAKDAPHVLDSIGDLVSELARIRQHGFPAEEMDAIRAAMLQEYEENATEADNADSRNVAEDVLKNFLTSESMAGPHRDLEIVKAIVPTITNEQLVAIAQRGDDTGRVVSIAAPPKGDVPDEAAIAKRIAEATAKQMPVFEAVDLSAPLITATPTAGKVTAEKPLSNGVTMWTLSNGVTVYLKPTDFKKDEVSVVGISNGGTSMVDNANYPQARFAADIVNAMGVGNYGPEELQKKLSGKKAGVAVSIDQEQEKVVGVASPNDLTEMFQLVHGAFVEPHMDQPAFDAWKTQQLTVSAIVEANTQAKFAIGAFDVLFDKHPRIPLPIPTKARIEVIAVEKALVQYKARMANAADFGFAIVGAFDAAKIKPLVELYLGGLPSNPKAKRDTVKDVGLRLHKGVVKKELRAGDEDKAFTMLAASTTSPWTPALEADAKILQGVLQIEMLEVLREKLGGTYSVSASVQTGRNPPQQHASLVIFESDPARAAAMQTEAWKTLDELATKPVKDDTLAKVKEQIAKSHAAELLENEWWVDSIERVVRYGDDLGKLVADDEIGKRVTADNVKKAVSTFAGKANRATITLLPEKK